MNDKFSYSKSTAVIFMVTCAILWSTAGILIKFLPWNPMVIAGTRSLISAGIYIIYMRYEGIRFVLNRSSVFGGIALSGTFLFFIAANKMTTSANAIVLQYSAPIFILMISALLFHQKFRKGDILTVGVTSVGISLFFLDQLSGGYLLGNLMGIAAGISFAFMFVITGRADGNERGSGILLGHLFTAIIGIPFVFLYETSFTMANLAVILAMGIFQLGIPYILYGLAVRKCSPLACSLISAIEPLLNPVWVFLFDGEAPGFFALVGGAVVIGAIVCWSIWSNVQEHKIENTSATVDKV
ncbi:MAG: family transporter [Bacillota bacterium]|jgi:drug/metabolite transporter (DMT)-like permease|nr:family transporter [Bacillota bacterium]